jgi:signal transduction histidine kinase
MARAAVFHGPRFRPWRRHSLRVFSVAGGLRFKRCLMSLGAAFTSLPKSVHVFLALVLVVIIAWLDSLMGWEVSLGVFYALPILLMVYAAGCWPAIATAALCSGAWMWVNWLRGSPLASTGTPFIWAAISRFIYFTCIAVAGAGYRKQRESDRDRIAALEHARTLEREIVNISEREQRRIGQDLHDGLCQVLAGIGCAVSILKDELRAKSLAEAETAEEIEGYIEEAATEARDLARGIFPVVQHASGLQPALEDLAALSSRLHQRRVDVTYDDGITFTSPEVSMHLYRIAQEAVSNALKHVKAGDVNIGLRKVNGHVRLTVEDEGAGIAKAAIVSNTGMGLRTMRYRAGLIGAHLEITPGPNGGTVVSCEMRSTGAI